MNSLDEYPIESKTVARSITIAQKRLEGLNYDSRKSIIEYDDVVNQQRLLTYKQRDSVLNSHKIINLVKIMIKGFVTQTTEDSSSFELDRFSSTNMINAMNHNIEGVNIETKIISKEETIDYISNKLIDMFDKFILNEDETIDDKYRQIILYAIDSSWQEQLERLNRLKTGIRYRQYAQKNPVQAYVIEADKLFEFFKKEIMMRTSLISLREINKKETKEISSSEEKRKTKDILIK